MATAKPLRKDITFSELNPDFFKWFHESVMGFDSEEYRREFWREARKLVMPSDMCHMAFASTAAEGIPVWRGLPFSLSFSLAEARLPYG
jgi:hypothetical protein